MKKSKRIYLGGGVYAADAETCIHLITKGKIRIALNAEMLDKLLSFLEQACGTTITVEKAEGRG